MSEFEFHKAERHRVPLRMAIGGPSGSGKTFTALTVARAVANSERVAVIDTEHRSAELYADSFDFDTLALEAPFTPSRYRVGIDAAVKAGFGVLVIDSLSHEWAGDGGVLQMVDEAQRQAKNKYTAWAVPSAEHSKLVEAILQAPIHIIATMREKMQYVIDSEVGKKAEVRKIGMQPIQREGMEFEFSIFAEMDLANTLVVTKSRYKSLQGKVIPKPGEEFVGLLLDEIERGSQESGARASGLGKAATPSPTDQDVGAGRTAAPSESAADRAMAESGEAPGDSSEASEPVRHPAPTNPGPCPKCGSAMLSGDMAFPNGPSDKWVCSKCRMALKKESAA